MGYLRYYLTLCKWLALGAEVGAPVAHYYPFKRCAAPQAELAPQPVGDPKFKVRRAQSPAGAEVVLHASPFIADGCPQHLANRLMEPFYLLLGQA